VQQQGQQSGPPQGGAQTTHGLKVFSIGELLRTAAPAPRWVIPKWLPRGKATLCSGDGGGGKSLALEHLCMSCAAGLEWMGLEVAQCNCLYVSLEDEKDEMHRRAEKIAVHMNLHLQPERLEGFKAVDLTDEDDTELMTPVRTNKDVKLKATDLFTKIEQLAREHKAGLIVIDAASGVFGGDENIRREVKTFTRLLDRLAAHLDAAIILIAHPSVEGMKSGRGYSGSTQWNNGPRCRWTFGKPPKGPDGLEPDPDLRLLELDKANRARRGEQIHMRWFDGVFVKVEPGSPSSAATELHHEQVFLELLDALTRQGLKVSAAVKGHAYAPTEFLKRARGKDIGKKALEAAMNRLLERGVILQVEEGSKSRKSGRLVRSLPKQEGAPGEDAAANQEGARGQPRRNRKVR
jgi:RecA-family ATPase